MILTLLWGGEGAYHHGMARPRVVDGGDVPQIWWVAANISVKEARTASLEVG